MKLFRRTVAAASAFAVCAAAAAAVAVAGRAPVVLQPGPAEGAASFLMFRTDQTNCNNCGRYTRFHVGANALSVRRGVLRFDVSAVPRGRSIASASLSLYHPDTLRGSGIVEVLRLTSPWVEGTGVNTCTGDGATWSERGPAGPWTTPGGDFDPAVVSSLSKEAGDTPKWDEFDVTPLVRGWVNRQFRNDGLLVKLADEGFSPCTTETNCNYWAYASDDWSEPTLRPKLTIVFD